MARKGTSSKSIWYPRYPGDYGRKTAHLSLMEHGAYALLMDYAYSMNGVIPANAEQVHRICRAFDALEQAACMRVLQEFFDLQEDGWHNERIEEEMLKRGDISEKRRQAALDRHAKASANAHANADANAPTTTATATYIGGGGSADAKTGEVLTIREEVLQAMGLGPDGVSSPSSMLGGQADMAELGRWLKLPGLDTEAICEEIRRVTANKTDGPPSSFRYFSKAMERLSGQLTAPDLRPSQPRRTNNDRVSRAAAADRAIIDAAAALPDDYFRDPRLRDRL